jgi:putative ABC transport system permease protein
MTAIWRELRIELRMLGKAPALTLAAVFAFGLRIAAATAMLSVTRTFLSNPIWFPEVQRLVMLLNIAPGQTEGWSEVSPANFQQWRRQNHSFESLAAYEWADVDLTGVAEPVKSPGLSRLCRLLRRTPCQSTTRTGVCERRCQACCTEFVRVILSASSVAQLY